MKFKDLREKSCGNNQNDLMLKILMGDSSDNIYPIHKKLGPKTAQKYIENNELLLKKLEDEESKNNFNLNKKLIESKKIPNSYIDEIINKFKKMY